MILYQKFINRIDLQMNKDVIYLFGDNLQRLGLGGQAKEMRGESNAFGIPTKNSPYVYMTDENYNSNIEILDELFNKLFDMGSSQIIVIPIDGLGTGLAKLDKKAPRTFKFLQMKLHQLKILHNESI